MQCARCSNRANPSIMSMFNEDIICMDCKTKERNHPLYKHALEVESQQVLKGNYKYAGIGKPADL